MFDQRPPSRPIGLIVAFVAPRAFGHALRCTVAALALSSLHATHAHGAEADPEAGRRSTVTCNGCHAQAGMQTVPNLGGQSPTYFVSAMRAYQDGTRSHATMRDVAKAWSDKELKNLAAWYAQFGKPANAEASVAERLSDVVACEACHGPEGRAPTNPESPVLAGQKVTYLKTALKEYREGKRAHAVMQGAAANLGDADIDALAQYFAKLPGITVK